MLGPEPHAATARAGPLPGAARGGHPRPGDAAVPLARRLRQGGAQRELRARADGAVHARPRLHRARHPPGGAGADRLPRRLARRRHAWSPPTTASATTRARKRVLGKGGRFDWKDVLEPVRAPPRPRAVHGRQALGLLRRRAAAPARRARSWRASIAAPATASGRVVGAILAHPALYRDLDRPTMVKSPVVFVAGALRSAGQGIERDAWTLAARGHGPGALPAALGGRLGMGHRAGSPRTRCTCASTPPTTCSTRRACGVEDESTRSSLSAPSAPSRAPAARWATRGRRRRPTASCCASRAGVLADEDRDERGDHVPARSAPAADLRPRRQVH